MIANPHLIVGAVVVVSLAVLVVGLGTLFGVPSLSVAGSPSRTAPSIAVSNLGYSYSPSPGRGSFAFSGTVLGNTTDSLVPGLLVTGQVYSSGVPVGYSAMTSTGSCSSPQFSGASPQGFCFTLSVSWSVSTLGNYVFYATASTQAGSGYSVSTPKVSVSLSTFSGSGGVAAVLGPGGNSSTGYLPPSPVVAPAYSWNYTEGAGPTTVTFADHSVVTGGMGVPAVSWTFGDGGYATGTAVSHVYTTDASFTVNETVTATGAGGITQAVVSHSVAVIAKTTLNCGSACQNLTTNTTIVHGTTTPPPAAQSFNLTNLVWTLIVVPVSVVVSIVVYYAAGWKFAAIAGAIGGTAFVVGLELISVGVI